MHRSAQCFDQKWYLIYNLRATLQSLKVDRLKTTPFWNLSKSNRNVLKRIAYGFVNQSRKIYEMILVHVKWQYKI